MTTIPSTRTQSVMVGPYRIRPGARLRRNHSWQARLTVGIFCLLAVAPYAL